MLQDERIQVYHCNRMPYKCRCEPGKMSSCLFSVPDFEYKIGDRVMVRAIDLLESSDWHCAIVVEIDPYPYTANFGCKVDGFGEIVFNFFGEDMKLLIKKEDAP